MVNGNHLTIRLLSARELNTDPIGIAIWYECNVNLFLRSCIPAKLSPETTLAICILYVLVVVSSSLHCINIPSCILRHYVGRPVPTTTSCWKTSTPAHWRCRANASLSNRFGEVAGFSPRMQIIDQQKTHYSGEKTNSWHFGSLFLRHQRLPMSMHWQGSPVLSRPGIGTTSQGNARASLVQPGVVGWEPLLVTSLWPDMGWCGLLFRDMFFQLTQQITHASILELVLRNFLARDATIDSLNNPFLKFKKCRIKRENQSTFVQFKYKTRNDLSLKQRERPQVPSKRRS